MKVVYSQERSRYVSPEFTLWWVENKKSLHLDLGFEVLVTAMPGPMPLPLGVSSHPWVKRIP